VHQDGLVHISALADKFVKDPHSVVKAGQVVKVKVLEVDEKRRRVALTMRMGDEPGQAAREEKRAASPRPAPRPQPPSRPQAGQPEGVMAAAFAKLRKS
jgi:uncharacterized protein